jgi:hypothetical protein
VKVVPLHADEGGIVVDDAPLIAPGEYLVTFTRHETAMMFTRPKIFVHFRIAEGPYSGIPIYAAFRAKQLRGRPRKGGQFTLGRSSELFRQYVRLTGTRERPDRITLSKLRNCVLRVRVGTVEHDFRQRPLPEACQYSVVRDLLSIEAGTPA